MRRKNEKGEVEEDIKREKRKEKDVETKKQREK